MKHLNPKFSYFSDYLSDFDFVFFYYFIFDNEGKSESLTNFFLYIQDQINSYTWIFHILYIFKLNFIFYTFLN